MSQSAERAPAVLVLPEPFCHAGVPAEGDCLAAPAAVRLLLDPLCNVGGLAEDDCKGSAALSRVPTAAGPFAASEAAAATAAGESAAVLTDGCCVGMLLPVAGAGLGTVSAEVELGWALPKKDAHPLLVVAGAGAGMVLSTGARAAAEVDAAGGAAASAGCGAAGIANAWAGLLFAVFKRIEGLPMGCG